MTDDAVLREPPDHVTDDAEQDRRLVRMMLALTPRQRLETLRNWARLAGRTTTGVQQRREPERS